MKPRPARPGGPPPQPYWFFTGYSEQRENFPLVKRFHDSVERQVRANLGQQTPGQGFVDIKDIDPGELWEDRIVRNGVCTTRAMLVLYSPSYFKSYWCAREWTVFTARVNHHYENGDGTARLIGVLWEKGQGQWPEAVDAYHYVRRNAGSTYEQHGLIHMVPGQNEPGSQEYRDIVLEVAGLIAKAKKSGLPSIKVDETRQLRPPFGPESTVPVDFVIAYAAEDKEWGDWAYSELEALGEVDVLPPGRKDGDHLDHLKIALRREGRVVMLVSTRSLTSGHFDKAALDAAYEDRELAADLKRLVPLFIEAVPEETVPASLRPFLGNALHDIPDDEAMREILVAAVRARLPIPAAALENKPADPPRAIGAEEIELVNNLSLASSLRDDDIRRIWFDLTGLNPADVPNPQLPLRTWLFGVLRVCRDRFGSFETLATALADLEGGSPEALQVRRIVDGLKQSQDP
ncbi:TIR domain-containing protein [Streptomyces sp. MBT62]|uniref:TIR domain-containing protein n=1 Tax=Streptomyces sp. MBT62 TaxID=2800410 RepID=UPI00190AD836|nr:TIR domain-containing protein [Streptomyces sp. MBT62]MBK3566865.1 toll/interleukin-1 receptor domain-containing protein [Streptomyces sp. MBT62]